MVAQSRGSPGLPARWAFAVRRGVVNVFAVSIYDPHSAWSSTRVGSASDRSTQFVHEVGADWAFPRSLLLDDAITVGVACIGIVGFWA